MHINSAVLNMRFIFGGDGTEIERGEYVPDVAYRNLPDGGSRMDFLLLS